MASSFALLDLSLEMDMSMTGFPPCLPRACRVHMLWCSLAEGTSIVPDTRNDLGWTCASRFRNTSCP